MTSSPLLSEESNAEFMPVHSVYALCADINDYTLLSSGHQAQLAGILQTKYVEAFKQYLESVVETYSYSSTGDGFMLAVKAKSCFTLVDFARNFVHFAICLHRMIRDGFTALERNTDVLSAAPVGISLRMGIHLDEAVCLSKDKTAQAQFRGPALNIAQRVMDYGNGWHILISSSVSSALEYQKKERIENYFGYAYTEVAFRPTDNEEVLIRQCPGLYRDKHAKVSSIWNLMGNGELFGKIGHPENPARGPKRLFSSLNPQSLASITKIFDQCISFWSVSLLPPNIWLSDQTLQAVLITQAAQTPKGRDFRRIYIWNQNQARGQNKQQTETVLRLNHLAGVKCVIVNLDQAISIAKEFPQEVRSDGVDYDSDRELNTFVRYPLQEFWLATKGGSVADAGFGEDTDYDGTYDKLRYLHESVAGKKTALKWFNRLWSVAPESNKNPLPDMDNFSDRGGCST